MDYDDLEVRPQHEPSVSVFDVDSRFCSLLSAFCSLRYRFALEVILLVHTWMRSGKRFRRFAPWSRNVETGKLLKSRLGSSSAILSLVRFPLPASILLYDGQTSITNSPLLNFPVQILQMPPI